MAAPVSTLPDTARWVAFYRALESERSDALFRDRYARALAGPDIEASVRAMRSGMSTAWAMIVRTAVMDEIILRLVRKQGVDLVVNLAAGLDTRPYRLQLPESLTWVEVDLPGPIDYKEEKLADERPRCSLHRERVDLREQAARTAFLEGMSGLGSRGLVITEGLLIYLGTGAVADLARDLHQTAALRWWLTDLASPRLLHIMRRTYGRGIAGDVVFRFAPEEGPKFFERHGWKLAEYRSSLEEAHRLGREMRGAWIPRAIAAVSGRYREIYRRMSGILLLERGEAR